MQDAGYGLRRIPLPHTPLNKAPGPLHGRHRSTRRSFTRRKAWRSSTVSAVLGVLRRRARVFLPARKVVAQRDQHGFQLPSLVVIESCEQRILGLALGTRRLVEVPPASGGQGHDVAAPIRRVSLASDETSGFERVEQRYEDAGIDAHRLPELALSRRSVFAQQTKKIVLARLEVVGVEGLAQAAHRVLSEQREQYPGAGPTLLENAAWGHGLSRLSSHDQ